MEASDRFAPGWPGIPARWTSSAKSGIGSAIDPESPIWFTLSHGILNEVYYPRIDQACTRDMGFIVSDGKEFLSEEKRDANSETHCTIDGIPSYSLTNTDRSGRYRIEKDILTDPRRPVLLQRTRFIDIEKSGLQLFIVLAPHLSNHGAGNTGWVGDYKGIPMLFAERDGVSLALACSTHWRNRSVGFVGVSDGWQDLHTNKQMLWSYTRAENGNLALTGEIDVEECGGEFVLALAFGGTAAEAAMRARASLQDGFECAETEYIQRWKNWQATLTSLGPKKRQSNVATFRTSAMVLRIHESSHFPGGSIASLSIPWGFSKGDGDLGGYHLVWSRDLVETATGLLAAGGKKEAIRVLDYLQSIQEADGHWAQNVWLDGTPYWTGIQMDETALPILLLDLLRREGEIDNEGMKRYWPMVRGAASFLAMNGPVSPQDRWEEDPGYSPFTIGCEIAALLASADIAQICDEPLTAKYLRELADTWYASIDRWMYANGNDWSQKFGVAGYYVRIGDTREPGNPNRLRQNITIQNVPVGEASQPSNHIISPDALALVRFGLRSADDPRIRDTITLVDALLKLTTPVGPVWHRYNNDGYGEHADGKPFDGNGIGRAWPLLTGERAHYELASGEKASSRRLLKTMESLSNDQGLIPEQIWDAPDIVERELFFGKPAGSAMPLVWAHAEHIKLLRSIRDGKVFDMPPQTVERYLKNATDSPRLIWRFNHKVRSIPAGKILRVECTAEASIHWSDNDWGSVQDTGTIDTGLGIYYADLDTARLPPGCNIKFTFFWRQSSRWEETDFVVRISG